MRAVLVAVGVVALASLPPMLSGRVPVGRAVAATCLGGWALTALAAAFGLAWREVRRSTPIAVARQVSGFGSSVEIVVERGGVARPGESDAVLEAIARQASTALGDAVERPTNVPGLMPTPWSPRRQASGLLLIAAAIVLWTSIPGGPARGAAWWRGDREAEAALLAAAGVDAPREKLGDLSLRYLYPDYTGLPPYEVTNSTGEARGVPGTRVLVTARSASAVDAAALLVGDAEAGAAEVDDGRTLRGGFTIGATSTTWSLLSWVGGEARRSPDYAVTVEPDLAPEVQLAGSVPAIEVAVDGPLDLAYTASDDFGLDRVVLEIDGTPTSIPIKKPEPRTKAVTGEVRARPIDLGMTSGTSYEVVVAAWDNDAISGSKVGRSRTLRVLVLGANGEVKVQRSDRLALVDVLLDLLGGHLEESFPPAGGAESWAAWGDALAARYQPLVSFLDRFRTARGELAQDLAPAGLALDAGRTLLRQVQVGSAGGKLSNTLPADAAAGREEAIAVCEDAILALDRVLRAEAFRALTDAAQDAVGDAVALRARLDAVPLDLAAVGFAIDRLMQRLERMEALSVEADDEAIVDLVGVRVTEARGLGRAVRTVATTDPAAAVRYGQRLADAVDALAAALQEELERRIESGKKQAEQAKSLLEALEALRVQQAALAERTGGIRASVESEIEGDLKRWWSTLETASQALSSRVAQLHQGAVDAPGVQAELEYRQDLLREILQAIDARDVTAARDAAGMLPMGMTELDDPLPWRAEVDALTTKIDGAATQLAIRADRPLGPADAGTLRGHAGEQRALEGELVRLKADAARLAQEFPVRPRGLEAALELAHARMKGATRELDGGTVIAAHGSEQAAERHLQDAIDALKQAMSSASQSQKSLEEGGGGGQGGEKGEEQKGGRDGDEPQAGDRPGGEDEGDARFELPEPEEFRTPEAYRQALLEGMRGAVPEAYEAWKRAYYEQLVNP
ncbi:MAG: hypothetical protein RLZZ383_2707 [Pseudomonadota bacterium]